MALPFGSQNISYIDNAFMCNAIKNGKRLSNEALVRLLISEIFFNDAHPENKNVSQEGDRMIIWNGFTWEYCDLRVVSEHIVNVSKLIIHKFVNSDM
jgi:hypothetical protein